MMAEINFNIAVSIISGKIKSNISQIKFGNMVICPL